jgi:hypothetical protein
LTTWDPANNGGATLSNGNLTAAFQTTNQWNIILSTTSKSAGKLYYEATLSAWDASGGAILGVADISTTLTNNYIGSSGSSIGAQILSSSTIRRYVSGASLDYTVSGQAVGNVFAVAMDLTTSGSYLFWWNNLTVGTGWTDSTGTFTGNPATGSGGTGGAGTLATAIFIAGAGHFFGSAADTWVLNPGPSSFSGTVPSGFSAWDAAAALTLMGQACL